MTDETVTDEKSGPFDDLDISTLVPEPVEHPPTVDSRCGTLVPGLRWAASVRGGSQAAFSSVHALVLAADHGIAAGGVSTDDPAESAERARTTAVGTGLFATLATAAQATVRVIDVGLDSEPIEGLSDRRVRRGSGVLGREDVLSEDELAASIALGRRIADEAVDAGADLLVPALVGVAASTPAATLVAATLYEEPTAVTARILRSDGRVDDETWMRRCAAIRDGLRRARPYAQDAPRLLAAAGGTDLAAVVGLLIQAAVRRTPVLLDGPGVLGAALVAMRAAPTASGWWWAPQVGEDPIERLAAEALYLAEPAARLGLGLGDGSGALALLPLLQTTLRLHAAPTARPYVSPFDAT